MYLKKDYLKVLCCTRFLFYDYERICPWNAVNLTKDSNSICLSFTLFGKKFLWRISICFICSFSVPESLQISVDFSSCHSTGAYFNCSTIFLHSIEISHIIMPFLFDNKSQHICLSFWDQLLFPRYCEEGQDTLLWYLHMEKMSKERFFIMTGKVANRSNDLTKSDNSSSKKYNYTLKQTSQGFYGALFKIRWNMF